MRANTATHTHTHTQRPGNENKHQPPRKAAATKAPDYHQFVARATNDAVRDWNLGGNTLVWHQGLSALLGYSDSAEAYTTGFWEERIHPAARSRPHGGLT